MNLTELKTYVDLAIENAKENDENPDDILVSIQVDHTESEALWSDDIELTYDNEAQASGCVLHGWSRGPEKGIILALKTIKSSMAFISHHGHHTGYDWNKDEHSLTKLEGDTFKMIDELVGE